MQTVTEQLVEALRQPGPNVPGCDCDRQSGDAEASLCEMHWKRLGPLQWNTLAFFVVDYEAMFAAAEAALGRSEPEALLRENGAALRRMGKALMRKRN